MKYFFVYLPEDNNLEKTIFLQDGFSFKAFIFTIFWTLYNKLYFISLLLLTSLVAIDLLIVNFYVDGSIAALMNTLIVPLICGLNGKQWLCQSLLRRKFTLTGVVIANNITDAQMKFFSEHEFSDQPHKISPAW